MLTFVRVVASFATVGLLLWMLAKASNGKLGALVGGASKGRSTDILHIVDRRQLTRNAGIAVVRAGEQHLLVGMSDAGIVLLAEGDTLAIAPETPVPIGESVAVDNAETAANDSSASTTSLSTSSARTRSWRPPWTPSPRMNFIATLREMTVRRS